MIGINEGLCLGSVIDAGVSTIFVGLGEDPMYVSSISPTSVHLSSSPKLFPSLEYPSLSFIKPLEILLALLDDADNQGSR